MLKCYLHSKKCLTSIHKIQGKKQNKNLGCVFYIAMQMFSDTPTIQVLFMDCLCYMKNKFHCLKPTFYKICFPSLSSTCLKWTHQHLHNLYSFVLFPFSVNSIKSYTKSAFLATLVTSKSILEYHCLHQTSIFLTTLKCPFPTSLVRSH